MHVVQFKIYVMHKVWICVIHGLSCAKYRSILCATKYEYVVHSMDWSSQYIVQSMDQANKVLFCFEVTRAPYNLRSCIAKVYIAIGYVRTIQLAPYLIFKPNSHSFSYR